MPAATTFSDDNLASKDKNSNAIAIYTVKKCR